MSKVASLNKALTGCAERLVDCASQLTELGLLKEEKAIYKLGKAIAEINDVRSDLYRVHPKLKPEFWGVPPTEKHFAAWFDQAKRVADDYCREGNHKQAIATFESFLFIGPSEKTASLAREEIARLKREHGA